MQKKEVKNEDDGGAIMAVIIAISIGVGIFTHRLGLGIAVFISLMLLISIGVALKDSISSKSPSIKKDILSYISLIIVLIFILCLCVNCSGNSDNPYKDVFNKDPNTWTDDEKEYVNDFSKWMDEQNED